MKSMCRHCSDLLLLLFFQIGVIKIYRHNSKHTNINTNTNTYTDDPASVITHAFPLGRAWTKFKRAL